MKDINNMTHQEIIMELTELRKSYLYEDDEVSKTIMRNRIKSLEQKILKGSF